MQGSSRSQGRTGRWMDSRPSRQTGGPAEQQLCRPETELSCDLWECWESFTCWSFMSDVRLVGLLPSQGWMLTCLRGRIKELYPFFRLVCPIRSWARFLSRDFNMPMCPQVSLSHLSICATWLVPGRWWCLQVYPIQARSHHLPLKLKPKADCRLVSQGKGQPEKPVFPPVRTN